MENMNVVSKEEILEAKKKGLFDRTFSALNLDNSKEEHIDFLQSKVEKIVSENMETVENIFMATERYYEASKLYEDYNKNLTQEHGLDNPIQGNPTKENKKKFNASIEHQQNTVRSNILKIEAKSREYAMLSPLDGLEFLKSVGINDLEDQETTMADVSNEIFKAKFFGFLAKLETRIHIAKKNFSSEVAKILPQIMEELQR